MAFTDDFSGEASDVDLASHTPSGGTAWTRTGNADSFVVYSTDSAVRSSNVSGGYYLCDDQGSANHYTQGRLKALTILFQNIYISARLVDSDNFIGWRLFGTGSAGSRLVKVVSGTVTDLVTHQGTDESVYKVECDGTNVKLYQDGIQQGTTQTVTDHQTETSQGLVNKGANVATTWLDDFEAGALGGGATEAAVSFGLSANSLFSADATLSASTNFGISANTTNTAQADRNASVGAALSFGSSNIGDAQAEAASSLITSFGVSDSAQADTYASVNAGFVFGYTVTATVVSGAAIQAAVTFAKTFNVTAETQADFQAAIAAGTVFGKTATAEVNFGASMTAGVQSGAQATADAQTEAAISVGTTLAAAIIAQAAVEAGITVASISNVTFSATSVSGDVITPDGRTFTVTAEARAFTVSEEDRNFTVQ